MPMLARGTQDDGETPPRISDASTRVEGADDLILTVTGKPFGAGRAWWMVAVLFTLYVFSWLDRLILSMLVTPIKADLGLSDVQMGLILGPSFGMAYALFGLPLGWAADNFSRRWVIFGGALTWAVATVACGLARSFETLLVARILVGAGEAALLPAAYSLIGDGFPLRKMTLATSVFQMASKFGSAIAYSVSAVIIALATAGSAIHMLGLNHPWQVVMVMVGSPVLILCFLVFTFPEPQRSASRAKQGKGNFALLWGFLRANAALCSLAMLSFSAIAIGGYALLSWLPTYIERSFGLKPPQYGGLLSMMSLTAAVALVLNGKLADTLFARGMKDVHLRLFSWQIGALVPMLAIMFSTSNINVLLLGYCMYEFVTGPLMVYVSALVVLLAPGAVRAQLLALYLFILTVMGLGIGPSLVGLLTDYVFHDEARLGTALAIVCSTSIGLAWILMRLALRHVNPAIERAAAA